jgi:hypothetical protein
MNNQGTRAVRSAAGGIRDSVLHRMTVEYRCKNAQDLQISGHFENRQVHGDDQTADDYP